MNTLEYIRELGCEVEKSLNDAVAQGMTDPTITDERHLIVQRNFIHSKLSEAQECSKRLVSLLEAEELFELMEMRSKKSTEEAMRCLLEDLDKLEKSNAKRVLDFTREYGDLSEKHLARQFYQKVMEPLELPDENTAIVQGPFTPEESFGRFLNLQESYNEFHALMQGVEQNISLSSDEKEKISQISYQFYIARIESHTNLIPQRVKYGTLTVNETLSSNEQTFLGTHFLPGYMAYLGRLAEELRRNHLKVFPLEYDYLQTEKEKFPSPSADDIDEKITVSKIQLAEERIRFWANVVRDRLLACTRMLERKQVIEPEELEAEESQKSHSMRVSMQGIKIPSWAYVAREQDSSNTVSYAGKIKNAENKEENTTESTIPLWLRKINGLNIRRFCQVCNQTYLGPTIFAQHFKEFRHSQCLSMIGIINLPAMHGVDLIDEAKLLWKQIIDTRKRQKSFWTETDVEYEDEFGDICTKQSAGV